ncbi:MAG: DUF2786 domain-containing protein [Acidimicrobiales bacterium]
MSTPSSDLVSKIAALCRKAESTDSPHEAEALMAGAQRLATLAAIDLQVARSYKPMHERPKSLVVESVDIGPKRKVGLRTYVRLFVAVARPNDVRVTVAADNTRVFAHGYDHDVAVLRCLYPSLLVQMVAASDSYVRNGSWREGYYTDRHGARRHVTARQARISFQESYAETIESRLFAARQDTILTFEPSPDEANGPTKSNSSDGASQRRAQLALVDKSAEVERFFRSKVATRSSWRQAVAVSRTAARAGSAAGRKAVLSSPNALGSSKGYLGAG